MRVLDQNRRTLCVTSVDKWTSRACVPGHWPAGRLGTDLGGKSEACCQGSDHKVAGTEKLSVPVSPTHTNTIQLKSAHRLTEIIYFIITVKMHLYGITGVQGMFSHEVLQAGQGQVSQVLLVLQSQPQLSQQQSCEKMFPAELFRQNILWNVHWEIRQREKSHIRPWPVLDT